MVPKDLPGKKETAGEGYKISAWNLKEVIYRNFLRTYAKVVERLGAVKARLAEIPPLFWEKIPETQFEKLWKSMPDHAQVVVEAKGWEARH